ncbi:MAG: hypothetical protein ACXVIQ_13880, partial [Ilumatobacteraceae bacterium]
MTVSETVMARPPEEVDWHGEAEMEAGDLYWFVVDGTGPLLDPDAMDVAITAHGPRCAFRSYWPTQPPLAV